MNREYIHGCIIGYVVGDAFGTPIEYNERDAMSLITEMESCYHHNLPVGTWSDRTGHLMTMIHSLIETKAVFDHQTYAVNYHQLIVHGKYNPYGHIFPFSYYTRLTSIKISSFLRYKHPIIPILNPEEIHQHDCEPLYRIAPIVITNFTKPRDCLKYVEQAVKLTHISRRCVDSARFLTGLIIGCLIGVHKRVLLSSNYNLMDATTYGQLRFNHLSSEYLANCDDCHVVKLDEHKYKCVSNGTDNFLKSLFPAVTLIRQGSYWRKTKSQVITDNNILNCLEAALWCFSQTNTFDEGCILAGSLGRNTPSVCAVYGMIAGAYYGVSQISQKWRSCVYQLDEITGKVDELYKFT